MGISVRALAQARVLVPQGDGGSHIHADAVVGLGVGGLAGQHVAADGLPHAAHPLGVGAAGRLDRSGGSGCFRSGCRRRRGTGQVRRGDLAVGAGALDAGEVHALGLGHIGGQGGHGGFAGHIAQHVPFNHQALRAGASHICHGHAVLLRPEPGTGGGEHPFTGLTVHGGGGRGGFCGSSRRGGDLFHGGGLFRAAQQAGDVLTGLAHNGDGLGDGHHISLAVNDLQKGAGGGGVHGDGQLVGLHLKKGLALGAGLSLFHQPFGNGAFLHQKALLGHNNDRCHDRTPFPQRYIVALTAATMSSTWGMTAASRPRLKGRGQALAPR